MDIATIRLRYSQLFVICLLGLSLYALTQSLSGGILQIRNSFWGRKALVNAYTNLRLALGDRVFAQALVGKDGWLEYTSVRNLDGYQNAISAPAGSLKNTQRKLEQLYETFRARNITFILVIAPNKATIYPDKLPDGIEKLKPQSQLDEFAASIKQHGPPVFIDLRPALLEGRKERDVYYKTDTHWNTYGSFIAYTEIMKELSKTYPQLAPKSIDDFEVKTTEPFIHDLPQIIGATHLLEPGISIKPKKEEARWITLNDEAIQPIQISITSQEDLPRLLIYVDSFGFKLKEFIMPHFSTAAVVLIHSKYPDALSVKTIDLIKPDVVIVEIVERSFNLQNLDYFLNDMLAAQK